MFLVLTIKFGPDFEHFHSTVESRVSTLSELTNLIISLLCTRILIHEFNIFVLQFSGIADNINGEESNKFTNTLGETVEVAVKGTQEETAQLLSKESYWLYTSTNLRMNYSNLVIATI